MKGFSGFGNSPLKHYSGSHKGAKEHSPHKVEDLTNWAKKQRYKLKTGFSKLISSEPPPKFDPSYLDEEGGKSLKAVGKGLAGGGAAKTSKTKKK
tara:strand:+ start:307 stop:591 length:285 start_codon:yes stop_codon:yes gene_type:complete